MHRDMQQEAPVHFLALIIASGFWIPHANVLGLLAPNNLPMRKVAEIRSQIDHIKEVLDRGTIKSALSVQER